MKCEISLRFCAVCAGRLCRGMQSELERALQERDCLLCDISMEYDGGVLL